MTARHCDTASTCESLSHHFSLHNSTQKVTLSLSQSLSFSSGPGLDRSREVTASVFRFSLTWVNSVGMREERVCLQVDSVAENWFAFLVLSTWCLPMNKKLNIAFQTYQQCCLGLPRLNKLPLCQPGQVNIFKIKPLLKFQTCQQCKAHQAPLPQLPIFSCFASTSPCCHCSNGITSAASPKIL